MGESRLIVDELLALCLQRITMEERSLDTDIGELDPHSFTPSPCYPADLWLLVSIGGHGQEHGGVQEEVAPCRAGAEKVQGAAGEVRCGQSGSGGQTETRS